MPDESSQGGHKMKHILMSVVFILLFSGCGISNEPNIEPKTEIKLTVKDSFGQEEDTFTQGEDIELELTITNHTNKDYGLIFSGSIQNRLRVTTLLDIEIMDTHPSFDTLGITELIVKPNETVVRSIIWDQKLLNGELVPPGEYTLYASFIYDFTERKQKITIQ